MPETTTNEPTKIEFIQYHQPALKDGDYEITLIPGLPPYKHTSYG